MAIYKHIHYHQDLGLTLLQISSTMELDTLITNADSVWVFGYGSLTWKPDFRYVRKEIGYISGYERRFWQGNKTHRGTHERVGRVATLVPVKKGCVWGVAYEISGEDSIRKALGGLCMREITLGGYAVTMSPFYPRDKNSETRLAVLYMATQDNDLFLGDCDIETMAMEILLAKGQAGPNTEYVTRLADYVREHIPEDCDDHLFELDRTVRRLSIRNECLNDIIGQDEFYETERDSAETTDDESVDGNIVETTKNIESNSLETTDGKIKEIYSVDTTDDESVEMESLLRTGSKNERTYSDDTTDDESEEMESLVRTDRENKMKDSVDTTDDESIEMNSFEMTDGENEEIYSDTCNITSNEENTVSAFHIAHLEDGDTFISRNCYTVRTWLQSTDDALAYQ